MTDHGAVINQSEDGEYVITCKGCDYRATAWYAIPALVAAHEIKTNSGAHLLMGLPAPKGPMTLINGEWVEALS